MVQPTWRGDCHVRVHQRQHTLAFSHWGLYHPHLSMQPEPLQSDQTSLNFLTLLALDPWGGPEMLEAFAQSWRKG